MPRPFCVYNRYFSSQSSRECNGVTVIWVSPCFGYPRTQIPSVLGTQNTESVKYHRLGQLKSSIILLKNHLYSYEALSQ